LQEEKELFAREVAGLHHQLKLLLGEEDGFVGDTPLLEMVKDCSEFVRTASEERLRNEAKLRELHAEIEGLNARVSELSMSNDVVASYLGSARNEKDQGIEEVVNRMLDALGLVGCQEEAFDGYGSGKIIQVEKSTLLLIDRVGQLEDENRKLVEQIEKDKEMVGRVNAKLANTKMEHEQEKVRCANTKEKLTMAVTKGKALVQHRDSLKQSLAEKTSELEKCLSELREKSSALEAAELGKGELVRSENLVAYLQETLLQRDSILEMVEEILSQTGVPEELQSMDIIERFRWLVEERNVLKGVSLEFQNLKDAFSSIDLPETVSSSDLEARVGWLKESFYRAKYEINTLQDEIAKSREAAHKEIDRLSASLSAALQEKDYLQTELSDMMSKYEKIVEEEHQVLLEKNSLSASLSAELEEKDSLRTELSDLMSKYEKIVEKELQVSLEKDQIVSMLLEVSGIEMGNDGVYQSSSDYSAIIQRCFEKIKEQSSASSDSSHVNEELFERVLSHLYVRDQELMLCDTLLEEEMMLRSEVDKLSNELKLVYEELVALKEEQGSLQKDLGKSEEKSTLLREKLSMAVKKGKGLVQDRENLKNLLEEKNSEIEKFKLELQQQESAVADCRDQINRLSTDVERIPELEADLVAMKDQRDQLEQFLLERNKSLQRVVESIEGIVLPVESVFEDPVGKVNWLSGYVNECLDAKTCAEQELGKVKENASTLASKLAEAQAAVRSLEDALSDAENNISRLAEEKREIEVGKTNDEQDLKKAIEEAQATVRSLEDALSVAVNNISRLAEEKREIEVGKTNDEQDLKKAIEQAQATVRSLEDALSVAENNISRLAEEKREIEVGKTNVEQELQKAIEEACSQTSKFVEACAATKSLEEALSLAENNVSVLFKEREEAQVSRADAEMELEKVKEEVAIQTSKLTEAYKTIKSLEDSLSQVETNVALLTEQNNGLQVGRTNLENELKKLREEAGSQADKLVDAYATIKSLEDTLLRAENDISVLEGAKKNAEEEVLSLNSKLSAALEELAGTSGSLESRSVELAGHYNDLQVIMKDDTLLSKAKECFEKKFESLKNMDLILKNIRDRFVDMDLEELQSQHFMEVKYYVYMVFNLFKCTLLFLLVSYICTGGLNSQSFHPSHSYGGCYFAGSPCVWI
jgi:chromosome segregation ATPase